MMEDDVTVYVVDPRESEPDIRELQVVEHLHRYDIDTDAADRYIYCRWIRISSVVFLIPCCR